MSVKNPSESQPESIHTAKAVLFELGDQLVAAEGGWNVLIADDTSGRLPARFIRQVLRRSGVESPMFFVVGAKAYRVRNSEAQYRDYFASIEMTLGQPLYPLLVTESVGTGQTVNFLKDAIRPHSGGEPQVASLVANPKHDSTVDFVGSYHAEDSRIVAKVFENRIPPSLGRKAVVSVLRLFPESTKDTIRQVAPLMSKPPSASNQIAGIKVDTGSPLPIAIRMDSTDPKLKSQAAAEIDQLVKEYAATRGKIDSRRRLVEL